MKITPELVDATVENLKSQIKASIINDNEMPQELHAVQSSKQFKETIDHLALFELMLLNLTGQFNMERIISKGAIFGFLLGQHLKGVSELEELFKNEGTK